MSTLETFELALELTGVGMGLVFLTLLLVMGAIAGLDRLFRPSAKADEAPASVLMPTAAAAGSAATDEAAAIAVALEQRKRNEAAAIMAAIILQRGKPTAGTSPFQRYADLEGTEIMGEVVTVTDIDSGAATWKGYGRLKAMS